MEKPSVCIIGAGIAGLTAAHLLIQKDVADVTVFEAMNRLGGRVNTRYLNEGQETANLVEMGANFIHGYRGNPIYKIANENKFKMKKSFFDPENALSLGEDGKKVADKVAYDAAMTFLEVQMKGAGFYKSGLPPGYTSDSSLGEYIEVECDKKLQKSHGKNPSALAERQQCVETLSQLTATVSGANSARDMSLELSGHGEEFSGGDKVIEGGYNKILQALAKSVPQEKLRLNSAVSSVNWSSGNDQKKVKVKLADGSEHSFDHVIVTCSLGYLKHKHSSLFEPSLPQTKVDAIERLGFGVVEKVMLVFDKIDFLPNNALLLTWGMHAEEASQENIPDWVKKIIFFGQLGAPNDHIMVSYISGDAAEHIQSLSDEQIIEDCHAVLKRFLGKETIPRPSGVIKTSWCQEPYIKGGYSYKKAGSKRGDMEALAEPMTDVETGKPLVQFAGEATESGYHSTVHGAYLSAQREVSRLKKYYNIPEDSSSCSIL